MLLKWIGGLCIMVGCAGTGFMIAANQKREERYLRMLVESLDFMICELEYKLTPLPQLCSMTAARTEGMLERFYSLLAAELEDQVAPNVESCVNVALSKLKKLPEICRECLTMLGKSLGRFHVDGQLKELYAVKATCQRHLDALCQNKEQRYRSYQTLGLCAGAGLTILFI